MYHWSAGGYIYIHVYCIFDEGRILKMVKIYKWLYYWSSGFLFWKQSPDLFLLNSSLINRFLKMKKTNVF